jgi:hypothetical protein
MGEGGLMWETPRYEIIETCAEATGYVYQR